MTTNSSNLINCSLAIGDVFTPKKYVNFAIDKFDIFRNWMSGKSIFDPTAGNGNILYYLVEYGLDQGYSIEDLPLSNLYGNELNRSYYQEILTRFQKNFDYNISSQISNKDIFEYGEIKYDIIFGNPPWQNFVDLPDNYKKYVKPFFKKFNLIPKGKGILLGNSRVDISALIIKKVIETNLVDNGESYFFLPLSIFLNDGAHATFRKMSLSDGSKFKVESIYDFKNLDVFDGVATRHGLAKFKRNVSQEFPIDYFIYDTSKWEKYQVNPLFNETDPYSVMTDYDREIKESFQKISIKKDCFPRQGINTCGANKIYFFKCEDVEEKESSFLVRTKFLLPKDYLHPLITTKNFKDSSPTPHKWVLLPYNNNGKPIEYKTLESNILLYQYFIEHKDFLSNRKGTMIRGWLNRGYWWSCLGVGKYNFAPYKVVWEAYGKSSFNPKLFEGNWQVNQSLQAYIPCWSKDEALRILDELKHPFVETYLKTLKMEGTMNWAQPGKIKKLLKESSNTLSLF